MLVIILDRKGSGQRGGAGKSIIAVRGRKRRHDGVGVNFGSAVTGHTLDGVGDIHLIRKVGTEREAV